MKILVAEDDPISNHSIKKILEYWGHEVIAVKDGSQALLKIKNDWKPDILLSDWEMPLMTGPELCKELRLDPINDDIYVIMLTANDEIIDMVEGFTSGVDDYISKPVTETELKESIMKGIKFINREEGFTDRDGLIAKNIMTFQKNHSAEPL